MLKRIFTIFIFTILITGMTKVQAKLQGDKVDILERDIDALIETKEGDIWKDLDIKKYNSEDGIIFNIEGTKRNDREVSIKKNTYDLRLIRVVESGYQGKDMSKYGLDNIVDLYTATKIALNVVYSNNSVSYIEENYRIKDGLLEDNITRASNILKAAQELVKIGYDGEESYQWMGNVEVVCDLKKDDVKEGYYSIKYKVIPSIGELKAFYPTIESDLGFEAYIANVDTGEKQTNFEGGENEFKVMIPEAYKEDGFLLKLNVDYTYNACTVFIGSDGENEYFIYANADQLAEVGVKTSNKRSNLAINFIDEETKENVLGCEIKVNEENYNIRMKNEIILKDIGKGNIKVEILNIPEEYVLLGDRTIEIQIGYVDNHVEEIKLKRKKGNMKINTNTNYSKYYLYNSDSEMINEIEITGKSEMYIENLNTGRYKLKQVGVQAGYKMLENEIGFNVEYEKTANLTIINEIIKQSTQSDYPKKQDKPPKEDAKDSEESKEERPKDKEEVKDGAESKGEEKPKDKEDPKGSENPKDNENKKDAEELIDIEKTKDSKKPKDSEKTKDSEESKNDENQKNEAPINMLPQAGENNYIIKILFVLFILSTISTIYLKKKTDCLK